MKKRFVSLFGIILAAVLVFSALPLYYVEASSYGQGSVTVSDVKKGATKKKTTKKKTTKKKTTTKTTVVKGPAKITFGEKKITSNKMDGLDINNSGTVATVNIKKSGTYELTGSGTSDRIIVNKANKKLSKVTLVLDNLTISNQTITDDNPMIYIGKNTKAVEIKLTGASTLTGPGGFVSAPAKGLIYDAATGYVRISMVNGAESPSLTLTDGMGTDVDYGLKTPSAGIFAAGKVVLKNGALTITSNGTGIQAKKTGVAVAGGDISITSEKARGIVSNSGNINVTGGDLKIVKTASDGLFAPSGIAKIGGGTVTLTAIGESGIRSENVQISGGTTSITTTYEYGATDFYDEGMGAALHNTRSSLTNNKITTTTEYINYFTGQHAGILAGTEGCTYSIKGGSSGTQKQSGSISITGGKLTVDTLASGTIATNPTTTTFVPAEQGLYIIGSPSSAIKSYNDVSITGGVHTLSAGDAAIAADGTMTIANDTDITISQAYNGLIGPSVNIGTPNMVNDTTQVKMYTGGHAIRGYSESRDYVYEDATLKKYKKTTVTNNNNKVTIYSGYVNAVIDNDKSVAGKGTGTLAGTNSGASGAKSGGNMSFNPEGNGINCSGDMEILGGATVIYGSGSGKSSPISYTGKFKIGNGATVLAMGYLGGTGKTTPTSTSGQGFISGDIPQATTGTGTGSTTGTTGTNGKITHTVKANEMIGLLSTTGNTIIAVKPPKDVSYIFYTSPKVKGLTYELYKGGELSGAVNTYNYDGRYQVYTQKSTGTTGSGSTSGGTSGTGGTSTTTGPTPLTTFKGQIK